MRAWGLGAVAHDLSISGDARGAEGASSPYRGDRELADGVLVFAGAAVRGGRRV